MGCRPLFKIRLRPLLGQRFGGEACAEPASVGETKVPVATAERLGLRPRYASFTILQSPLAAGYRKRMARQLGITGQQAHPLLLGLHQQ